MYFTYPNFSLIQTKIIFLPKGVWIIGCTVLISFTFSRGSISGSYHIVSYVVKKIGIFITISSKSKSLLVSGNVATENVETGTGRETWTEMGNDH